MTASTSITSGDDKKYFLWFSDVHYDPYYATKDAFRASYNTQVVCNTTSAPSIGNIGCDAPKTLVESALKYASEIAASPSFIILSGDSSRHGVDMLYANDGQFNEGAESRADDEVEMAAKAEYHVDAMKKVGDIMNELATMFAEAFPDVEIIISLGNNDVVPDYYLQLQDEPAPQGNLSGKSEDSGMLGIIYNALSIEYESSDNFKVGLKRSSRSLLSSDDKATYLRGGYYSRVFSGLTVLSINTVLYSSLYEPKPLNAHDPGLQFTWMRKMLTTTRENGHSQAIIVGHIPPAVGSFRHSQLWKENYISTYYAIVHEFDDIIAGQLFGHLHTDEFRVGLGQSAIPFSLSTPLLLTGSLTPLHGNNPSFRKVFFGGKDDTVLLNESIKYRLLDYESHRYPMSEEGEWTKLYTFSETYVNASDEIKRDGLSANVFRSILQSMKDEQGDSLQSFLSLVSSGSDGYVESSRAGVGCDEECRSEWICTLSGTTTVSQYNKCLSQKKREYCRHMIGIAGATLFAIASLYITAAKLRRRRIRELYESTSSVDGTVEMEDHEML